MRNFEMHKIAIFFIKYRVEQSAASCAEHTNMIR